MPKFTVTLQEIVDYEVIVDAADEDEAAITAEETFVQSEDITEFNCVVHNREVANIERMSEDMAADA